MSDSILIKLDHALSHNEASRMDQLAKKARKKKLISAVLEEIYIAQSLFAARFDGLPFDIPSTRDPLHFDMFVIDHAVSSVAKQLKSAQSLSSNPETRWIKYLLCKYYALMGHYEMALQNADMDTNLSEKETALLLEQVLLLQGLYFRGIALEMTGKPYHALAPYSKVLQLFQQLQTSDIVKTKAIKVFVSLSLYRHGILSDSILANPSMIPEKTCLEVINRLCYEATISLRIFLGFDAWQSGSNRLKVALNTYMSFLEKRFRRFDYRIAFDPFLCRPESTIFMPESVQEDIALCTLLSHAIGEYNQLSVSRLARSSFKKIVLSLCEQIFLTEPVDCAAYFNLMCSQLANCLFHEAYLTGKAYVSIGGKDEAAVLLLAKISLLFNPNESVDLLTKWTFSTDFLAQKSLYLAKAYLCLAKSSDMIRKALGELDAAMQIDPSRVEIMTVKAFAYMQLGEFQPAEESLRKCFELDESDIFAWYLLAILKIVQNERSDALSVCTMVSESEPCPSIMYFPVLLVFRMCLLKAQLLSQLGQHDSAIEMMRAIMAFWTKPKRTLENISTAEHSLTISKYHSRYR